MIDVVVLTDLHITVTPRPGRPDADARLRSALEHVARDCPDAGLVVLCGDLTHWGDVASYQRLRDLLAGFPLPVQMLIGNHDDRANFLSVFPRTPVDPDGHIQSVRDIGDTRLIFLDSNALPLHAYPAAHAGLLTDDRLAWLDVQLGTEKGCVIFLHHPAMPTGFVGMDAIRLVNGAALLDMALRHGTVRHIVAGHVHRTISGSWRGIPFSIFKSLVGQQPFVFDMTDTSVEVDEPPAYGLLRITPGSIVVHTEDFGLTDLTPLRRG